MTHNRSVLLDATGGRRRRPPSRRAIYDNSAEVSGRVKGEDGPSDLFRCFTYCAHINTVANKTAYDRWLVIAI